MVPILWVRHPQGKWGWGWVVGEQSDVREPGIYTTECAPRLVSSML